MAAEGLEPRQWLGRLLGPEAVALAQQPTPSFEQVADCAIEEKVASLTQWRLQQLQASGAAPAGAHRLSERLQAALQEDALAAMVQEHETRSLHQHLDRLGMPALILKGAALAHWAYAQPQLRRSNDIDLLVRSYADATRLAEHLSSQGYGWPSTSDSETGYELLCTRRIGPELVMEIDIHWAVHVSPIFAGSMPVDALFAAAQALPVLCPNALGLGPVDALLHASVNRALDITNGLGEPLRLQHDFIAITARFDDSQWLALVDQAKRRRLSGAVCSALDAATHHLGAQWPAAALLQLHSAAEQEAVDHRRYGDWLYMQMCTWRALPGLRARLLWLRQRLLPNRGYLEHQHGGGHSYTALLWRRAASGLRKLLR